MASRSRHYLLTLYCTESPLPMTDPGQPLPDFDAPPVVETLWVSSCC